MPGSLTFRTAVSSDAPLLRAWDDQPHVVASDPHDDWNWEAELPRQVPWRWMFIAESAGRPVGFLQIIDPAEEETHCWECSGPDPSFLTRIHADAEVLLTFSYADHGST